MAQETWAFGVDLGGTKVEVAVVNAQGAIRRRLKEPTDVEGGPDGITAQIARMIRQSKEQAPASAPAELVGAATLALRTGGT